MSNKRGSYDSASRLKPGEKLLLEDRVRHDLKAAKNYPIKSIVYWVGYIGLVIFCVMAFPEHEQHVVVQKLGKITGIALLIFLAVFIKTLTGSFRESSPSRHNNKYLQYKLTDERMIFLSERSGNHKSVILTDIQSVDVIKKSNHITFHLSDPHEPTVSLNGIPSPMKLAKLIDTNLKQTRTAFNNEATP